MCRWGGSLRPGGCGGRRVGMVQSGAHLDGCLLNSCSLEEMLLLAWLPSRHLCPSAGKIMAILFDNFSSSNLTPCADPCHL